MSSASGAFNQRHRDLANGELSRNLAANLDGFSELLEQHQNLASAMERGYLPEPTFEVRCRLLNQQLDKPEAFLFYYRRLVCKRENIRREAWAVIHGGKFGGGPQNEALQDLIHDADRWFYDIESLESMPTEWGVFRRIENILDRAEQLLAEVGEISPAAASKMPARPDSSTGTARLAAEVLNKMEKRAAEAHLSIEVILQLRDGKENALTLLRSGAAADALWFAVRLQTWLETFIAPPAIGQSTTPGHQNLFQTYTEKFEDAFAALAQETGTREGT